MLREITKIKANPDEPRKRWFTNSDMDLFIWFNEQNQIISYQLTYNKGYNEKALTWDKKKGFSHLKVDYGTSQSFCSSTPFLIGSTPLNPKAIVQLISNDQGYLSSSIKGFIIDGIENMKKEPDLSFT